MNRTILITIFLASGMLVTCTPCNDRTALNETGTANTVSASLISGERIEVPIDVSKSVVKWKGTKFFGAGSHEGTVKFEKGRLLFTNEQLTGGEFVVDMGSIYNTDIPEDDPIPRRNLTNHLHSDFETGEFPTASFIIRKVEPAKAGALQITGELTIRGITKLITISATEAEKREEYIARFAFDRFDWRIGEGGSWLEKKVVDAEIALTVHIFCDPST